RIVKTNQQNEQPERAELTEGTQVELKKTRERRVKDKMVCTTNDQAQTDVAVLQSFARYQLPLSAIGRYATINGESDSRPT
ncbi:unnamed protein product, partial [Heterotrigona itama]